MFGRDFEACDEQFGDLLGGAARARFNFLNGLSGTPDALGQVPLGQVERSPAPLEPAAEHDLLRHSEKAFRRDDILSLFCHSLGCLIIANSVVYYKRQTSRLQKEEGGIIK